MARTKSEIRASEQKFAYLKALERKILWLSSWTIHNANHIREARDGLKVGGHQASCASVATLMTALYFDVLRPQDRVAVKPHASPIYHAIQYLLGNQSREKLKQFRLFLHDLDTLSPSSVNSFYKYGITNSIGNL